MNAKSLILLIAVCVAGLGCPSLAAPPLRMETWTMPYSACGQASVFCSWTSEPEQGARTLTEASALQAIRINVVNVPASATVVETCFSLRRDSSPATYPWMTGGYSELFCWHAARFGAAQDWSANLDLSAFPLYIPAGSTLICGGNLYGTTEPEANQTLFSCTAEHVKYSASMPRHRVLRLPYVDLLTDDDGSIPGSPYLSGTVAPLKIKAAHLFQSFGGDDTPATLWQPCLRWEHAGQLMSEACFGDQQQVEREDYDSPTAVLPVNWTLPVGDVVTVTGQQSRLNTDAALYAVVEIPAAIVVNPENVVRDYGNVDQAGVQAWGTARASRLLHPWYCNWASSCDDSTKVSRLLELFQPAACIPAGTCTKKK